MHQRISPLEEDKWVRGSEETWVAALFYYFLIIAAHQPSRAQRLWDFLSGRNQRTWRSMASAAVTLMIAILYASGYFKTLAKARPSTSWRWVLLQDEGLVTSPVQACKSQRIVGDLASKMDQETHTDQAERGTPTPSSLEPARPLWSLQSQQKE